MSDAAYLGVDVGTGSARAGLFDARGRRLGSGQHPLRLWYPREDHVEQSSSDVWQACCRAVRAALAQGGVEPARVHGLAFDATCSLVVLGEEDEPLPVSPGGEAGRNVIVWMDHRALAQAERVNATGHAVLRYVGGRISPEMQVPKLLWLKEHAPDTWRRARRFLDLPDYLSYCATGDDVRSLCTTVCKWTYLGHEDGEQGRWDASFFESVGLEELARESFRRIGRRVRPMGEAVGRLSARAAAELGLTAETRVSVSIIDAHAGGVGMLGALAHAGGSRDLELDTALALIAGTSSCHMAVSREPRFVPGVWGPYYSAMVPGMWLNEGGQSATGSLLDHVLAEHSLTRELEEEAAAAGTRAPALLEQCLAGLGDARCTREVHVLPYFHGNRSPRADATLRGMISGLRLERGRTALAVRYRAVLQALAYGTRHILEELDRQGYRIDTLVVCGGLTHHRLFLREHADATRCRILLPAEPDAVQLGSAMLAAVAAGRYSTVLEAMSAMSGVGETIEPGDEEILAYHDRKYAVFQRMYEDQKAYRRLMEERASEDRG